MKLLSTTIFSGISAFVKIASGFIATKVISSFAGPAGVALVGSLTNFMAVVLSVANGSVNSGIVKYTSEFKDNRKSLKVLYDTSVFISLFCSALVSMVLLLFSNYWSEKIFHSTKYQSVIVLLGVGIVFYSFNTLILAFLNGLGYIKKYTFINGVSSVFTLVLTIFLIYYYQVIGALYALVISQFLVFFVACILVYKHWIRRINLDFLKPDVQTIKNLGQFSLMVIVSSSVMPLAQIFIRNFITQEMSIDNAGIWQGLIRISDGYLLMVNITLGTYFLPKLSSLKDNFEIKKEIFNGVKFLAPLFLCMCLTIFLGRFYIIQILYNEKFLAMEELFFWQLIGDFFKVLSLIFSYLMISKVMTKVFIITELLFAIFYVVFTLICVPLFGLKGATISFFIVSFLCFVIMLFIFRKTLFFNKK